MQRWMNSKINNCTITWNQKPGIFVPVKCEDIQSRKSYIFVSTCRLNFKSTAKVRVGEKKAILDCQQSHARFYFPSKIAKLLPWTYDSICKRKKSIQDWNSFFRKSNKHFVVRDGSMLCCLHQTSVNNMRVH